MRFSFDVYHAPSIALDTFISTVLDVIAREQDRGQTVRLLRPAFARLLNDKSWLPAEFSRPDLAGGMGQGLGNYLIFRSANHDLSLMSLVIPADASTPVHDHLAWGLVGLYSGEQTETLFHTSGPAGDEGAADLVEVEQRHLHVGDFYELLPPEGDIHRVTTIGDVPSVSIHLLGNDIGCTWRHRYEPEAHRVYPFRSGYSNQPCLDEP
jgi:3-mercaptopropionate dioxygenase